MIATLPLSLAVAGGGVEAVACVFRRCAVCHRPIPAKRLEARPEATRCVQCQSAHDLDPAEALDPALLAAGMAAHGEMDSDYGHGWGRG